MSVERRTGARRQLQSGLAMVEFALSVPVLLLLMFASFEFGHFMIQYSILNDTVRNASRYVAGKALGGTTDTLVTGTDWSTLVTQGTNLAVYGNIGGTGAPILPSLNAANVVTVTPDSVDRYVTVKASYPYQPLFGAAIPTFMGGSMSTTFTLNISVTMSAL